MPRARRAKARSSVAVLNPSGRYTYLSESQLRKFEEQGRISRDTEGRWSFNGVFRHALSAAKGRVHQKAKKPGWNGGEPTGGGIFRSRPRIDDATRALRQAETEFQAEKQRYIDALWVSL